MVNNTHKKWDNAYKNFKDKIDKSNKDVDDLCKIKNSEGNDDQYNKKFNKLVDCICSDDFIAAINALEDIYNELHPPVTVHIKESNSPFSYDFSTDQHFNLLFKAFEDSYKSLFSGDPSETARAKSKLRAAIESHNRMVMSSKYYQKYLMKKDLVIDSKILDCEKENFINHVKKYIDTFKKYDTTSTFDINYEHSKESQEKVENLAEALEEALETLPNNYDSMPFPSYHALDLSELVKNKPFKIIYDGIAAYSKAKSNFFKRWASRSLRYLNAIKKDAKDIETLIEKYNKTAQQKELDKYSLKIFKTITDLNKNIDDGIKKLKDDKPTTKKSNVAALSVTTIVEPLNDIKNKLDILNSKLNDQHKLH